MTEPSRRHDNLQAAPVRIIGFGYELPQLPITLAVGMGVMFRAKPATVALSIDGGPMQTVTVV